MYEFIEHLWLGCQFHGLGWGLNYIRNFNIIGFAIFSKSLT